MNLKTLSRWITLSGALNTRDLGGYPAGDGQTRWQSLLRADSQHRLTPEDRQILIEYGLRTVIDLRHADELETAPAVWQSVEGVTYVHVPIFRLDRRSVENAPRDLANVYRFMVDQCQPGIRETLTAIAEADDGVVLFNCTVGKDRTGIVAALLLGIVGTPTETIIEDYALTEQAMQKLRPLILAQVEASGGKPELLRPMLTAEPADMRDLLAYLDNTYGGLMGYIDALGITLAQQARIRARLIAPINT